MNGGISVDRILQKLDQHLHKNDYQAAQQHLQYWLAEAQAAGNYHVELTIRNELMGLFRKIGQRMQALDQVDAALQVVEREDLQRQVGAATTYLNGATVYKAFDMADRALPLFEKARSIYETQLDAADTRLAGLYNNMALALVDLQRFDQAKKLYQQAIDIMQQAPDGAPEIAITLLNMASAAEAQYGAEQAEAQIAVYLDKAQALLEGHTNRNGYYAFVCEKCAGVFGYYGYFVYEQQLTERARRIYEGT